ncbi:kinase-like domain-containing protein, partial [Auriculariales sp. MPI-PUGE-AT-0066]
GNKNFTVERLTGGFVNWVGRVTIDDDKVPSKPAEMPQTSWNGARSVIAKYATPYIFTAGPAAPFSILRQTIEARSLALFASTPFTNAAVPNTLSGVPAEQPAIRVPRLLFHDSQTHVLLQEDLGTLPSLGDWLVQVPSPSEEATRRLGTAVGTFLATIHKRTRDPAQELRTLFANEDAVEFVVREVISPLRKDFALAGLDGANLCNFLEQQWRQGPGHNLESFCHGDLWHASVLVAKDEQYAALIDWEFAGVKTIGSDLAQCTAFLKMLAQSPKTPASAPVVSFNSSMLQAYQTTLGHELSTSPELQAKLKLLFGLNLANAATWHPWCDCAKVAEHHCEHVLGGVREAARWIQIAMYEAEGHAGDWFDTA